MYLACSPISSLLQIKYVALSETYFLVNISRNVLLHLRKLGKEYCIHLADKSKDTFSSILYFFLFNIVPLILYRCLLVQEEV